jgi:protein O-mannosyl-transferase
MSGEQTPSASELVPFPQALEPAPADRRRLVGGSLVILLAAFAVYLPALGGQFLWDDILVVQRNPLVTGQLSFGNIWFKTDFPLSNVAFWLEHLVWGNHVIGYHVVNVLLHGTGAVLLWRVLARLKVPGAWLAAMIFTVHPLCVASVAWISELKNTLSLPFFLISLIWYLRTEADSGSTEPRIPISRSYIFSLIAFLLALLSKTSTVMLPVVLLACAWWQRGQIRRLDWLRAIPFFALALVFGLMSIEFQVHGAMAGVAQAHESFWVRLAASGMALWFYLGKALLPLNLCMVYSRWRIEAAAVWSYLPLFLWCGLLAACWAGRRSWGRHLFFGLGCFTVMLFPVLGFFDMYFLALSRVSDHFAYLPLTALVALAAAGLGCRGRLPQKEKNIQHPTLNVQHPMRPIRSTFGCWMFSDSQAKRRVLGLAAGCLVAGFAALTMLRAPVFVSEEALWRDTLRGNPAAWCAHANLGWILASQQKYNEAREHLATSLKLNPDNAQAHSNLGRVLAIQRQFAEAEPEFQTAVSIKPKDPDIRRAYAAVLAEQGRRDEAMNQLQELLALKPDTEARSQLASLLYQAGRYGEAVAEYRKVVATKHAPPEVVSNLAWLLATSPDSTVRNGADAVRYAEQACRQTGFERAQILTTLAAAFAEAGRFTEAVGAAQKAAALARAGGNAQIAAINEQLLGLYRAGKPYHMPPPK